jgi:hypothetical protein
MEEKLPHIMIVIIPDRFVFEMIRLLRSNTIVKKKGTYRNMHPKVSYRSDVGNFPS